MLNRRSLIPLAILSLSLSTTPCWAQDQAAAEALFRSAQEAGEQGDWITACDRFEESNRLDPAPGTVLNIARCREKLGQLASAWKSYQEASQKLPSGDRRAKYAKKRAQALEGRVPHLVLLAPDSDVEFTVEVNGIKFESATLGVALPFDPGKVTVIVRSEGRKDWSSELTLEESDRQEQQLELGEPGESEAPAAATSGEPASREEESRVLEYSLLGIGGLGLAAAIGGGIWIGIEIPTVKAECPDHECTSERGLQASSRGRTATALTAGGAGLALIGLGLGSYLLFSDEDESVGVAPYSDGAMLNYQGTF